MEAWLTNLYQRHRASYVRGAIYAIYGFAIFVTVFLGVIGSRFEDASTDESIVGVAALVGMILLTFPALHWVLRRERRELISWAGGDRTGTAAARRARDASLQITQSLLRAGLRVSLVVVPTIAPLILLSATHNLAVDDYAAILIGAALGTLQWGITSYFALDLAMRPIARETGEAVGDYAARPSAAPLATKLVLGVGASTLLSGLFVGALTSQPGTGAGGLFKLYVLGAVASLLIGLVAVVLILLGVLGPIRELITGTRWVATGGLGWRVPVVSTDELGELAGSFNRMAEELGRRNEELRASRARLVASAAEARQKVERDLHDGAQQHLVLVDLKLGLARRTVENDPKAVQALEDARADLAQALSELRDLAHGIYPAALSNDGLRAALEETAGRATIPTSVEIDQVGRHRPELEAAVYFCCLEALQNAGKYAGEGANATIKLARSGHELKFTVRDDGKGFDPASVNGSAGLQNMADRIGALGGDIRIDSKPGEGTTVSGSVPVHEQSAA